MNTQSYGWENDDSSDWSESGDWSDWSDIDQSDFVAITKEQFIEAEIKEEKVNKEDTTTRNSLSVDSPEKI